MAGSSFGTIFRMTTWGESHGVALGVVVDGCPAGVPLEESTVQAFLDRRKPGQNAFSTPRKESDTVRILSGVFEGKTTGAPISMLVENENQHSKDYSNIADVFRPGHADFGFYTKYGLRDYRGGGRSSGRETIGRVAAGAVAAQVLSRFGVTFTTYVNQVGPIRIDPAKFDASFISENPLVMPDRGAYEKAAAYLEECRANQDSSGAMVECIITGVPAGLGDPVFEKLDARLAGAMFSIGAVKGFEIGDGFSVAGAKGSENNDPFVMKEGKACLQTNHSGGILGGISSGADIVFRVAFKPTPSIASLQHTVNEAGEDVALEIAGRHDPIVAPRAAVVVESMAAVTLLDAILLNRSAKVEHLDV